MATQEELMKKMQDLQMRIMSGDTSVDPNEIVKIQQEMISACVNVSGNDLKNLVNSCMQESDDFYDDEYKEFINAHPQPKEFEKYLAMGSFLVTLNYEPYQTLEMTSDSDDIGSMLSSSWEVNDKKSAKDTFDAILNEGHREELDDLYLSLKNGNFEDIDEGDIESFNDTVNGLIEFGYSINQLNACNSIIAWDIDRAAFLARAYVAMGYITKEECWKLLKITAEKAKEHFTNWDDYAISFMMGRAVSLGFHMMYLDVLNILRNTDKGFLDSKPLSKF